MEILLHAPQLTLPEAFSNLIVESVRDELATFESKLTRVEVHLKTLEARSGKPETRCVVEARPRGLDPLTANHESDEAKTAFQGALGKLTRVLEHRFGKLGARRRGE